MVMFTGRSQQTTSDSAKSCDTIYLQFFPFALYFSWYSTMISIYYLCTSYCVYAYVFSIEMGIFILPLCITKFVILRFELHTHRRAQNTQTHTHTYIYIYTMMWYGLSCRLGIYFQATKGNGASAVMAFPPNWPGKFSFRTRKFRAMKFWSFEISVTCELKRFILLGFLTWPPLVKIIPSVNLIKILSFIHIFFN